MLHRLFARKTQTPMLDAEKSRQKLLDDWRRASMGLPFENGVMLAAVAFVLSGSILGLIAMSLDVSFAIGFPLVLAVDLAISGATYYTVVQRGMEAAKKESSSYKALMGETPRDAQSA